MSKQKQITTLAIPATQPKPSRADYINAMVERARIAHNKNQAEIKARKDELEKSYTEEVDRLFKANKGHVIKLPGCPRFEHDEADVIVRVKSAKLKAITKERESLNATILFDEKEERRAIAEMMQRNSPGLKALLNNPDACEAMDKLLGVD